MFTTEERQYLNSLPAVYHVGAERILYTDEFKYACITRYLNGESPTAIFREAGLNPELVGRKRIDRCFARWCESEEIRRRLSKRAHARHASEDDESDGGADPCDGTQPYAEAVPGDGMDEIMHGPTGNEPPMTGPAGVDAPRGIGESYGIHSHVGNMQTDVGRPSIVGPTSAGIEKSGHADAEFGNAEIEAAGFGHPAYGIVGQVNVDHRDDDAGVMAYASHAESLEGVAHCGICPNRDGTDYAGMDRADTNCADADCEGPDCDATSRESNLLSAKDVRRIRRTAVAGAVRGEATAHMWDWGEPDYRERLIEYQIKRIDALEREIAQLRNDTAAYASVAKTTLPNVGRQMIGDE
ncbi:hypothetical protein [Bifidobacterium tissieri]|uniref:Uncharacterized protein n=1 Tax=Bifidobacterium tissieri TaxID=1630162 RepID=A0A5M9ZK74_9BIFI|nr:hypothetical protein [Bifidobacterium tissieri]KAA8827869.1 hypothetical protein EMO89_10015 [Bifidobacterium tissieri]KAA8829991.1 hypothetical protein EM849_10725 [Bifidobacterium tissieri]